MMVSFHIDYVGELRCHAVHGPSGTRLMTDAPVDNHGKGESFSPTDLVATALGACEITMMGILARQEGWNLRGTTVDVEKHMSSDLPRRIARLVVRTVMVPGLSAEQRRRLELTARTCPVMKSIHPDITVDMQFAYPD